METEYDIKLVNGSRFTTVRKGDYLGNALRTLTEMGKFIDINLDGAKVFLNVDHIVSVTETEIE